MKKLFAGIFATVLGLGCLTACGENKYDVAGAADYLDAMYIDRIGDGRVDYEVLNTVAFGGVTYDVEWSVNVSGDITLVRGETTTKVDVNEAATQDVDYELTAVVKDPNGQTATVKFLATLLKAKALIPVEITEKPVEGTAYKLYVYNNDAKKDCYFDGDYQATFYLGSVEDYEESVDVYVEYVENSDSKFNLYFEHKLDGKQYVGIRENWNSTKNYWSYNPVIAGEPVSSFEYSTEHSTIITEVPACSVDEQTATQDTTKTIYWGNSGGTYTSIGGVDVSKINESGYVANLVKMESAANVTAADKIAFEKDALLLEDSFVGDATVEVATIGKRYPDVQISWAVTGDNIAYADGEITITSPTAETTATVTATFTLGETTDTKEFTLTLKPVVSAPKDIVDAAYELASGAVLGEYTLTGIIVKVDTAYSTEYENVTVTITVPERGNKPVQCFRMKGEGADTIAVGDVITVTGTIKNYNGTIEFDSGCRMSAVKTAAATVDAAYALATGASLEGTQMLTGVITSVDEAFSTQYNNVTVTMQVGDKTDKLIKCFRMKGEGADTIKVGDTITVSGIIKNYNGTIEFDANCILESYKAAPAASESVATVSFADATNRTVNTTSQQVFVQNGVTFTYDKNNYSNNLADYTNPMRCYSGTKITIAYNGMTKIMVNCNSASYATALINSIGTMDGVTATANGSVVTIVFAEVVNTFSVVLSAQVRIDSIDVIY